jgi:hypothetical protein
MPLMRVALPPLAPVVCASTCGRFVRPGDGAGLIPELHGWVGVRGRTVSELWHAGGPVHRCLLTAVPVCRWVLLQTRCFA